MFKDNQGCEQHYQHIYTTWRYFFIAQGSRTLKVGITEYVFFWFSSCIRQPFAKRRIQPKCRDGWENDFSRMVRLLEDSFA